MKRNISKKEKLKSILSAHHQEILERTKRNPSWDDIWGLSPRTTGLSLNTERIPSFDKISESHKKSVNQRIQESLGATTAPTNRTQGFIGTHINFKSKKG